MLVTRGLGRSEQLLVTAGLGRTLILPEEKVRPYGDRWHDRQLQIQLQQEDEEMIILLRAIVEVISCR